MTSSSSTACTLSMRFAIARSMTSRLILSPWKRSVRTMRVIRSFVAVGVHLVSADNHVRAAHNYAGCKQTHVYGANFTLLKLSVFLNESLIKLN